jgi:hypothetical protein
MGLCRIRIRMDLGMRRALSGERRCTGLHAAGPAGAPRDLLCDPAAKSPVARQSPGSLMNSGRDGRLAAPYAPHKNYYSARNASSGSTRLARNAGIKDAASAAKPSVTTATNVTAGSYGFKP